VGRGGRSFRLTAEVLLGRQPPAPRGRQEEVHPDRVFVHNGVGIEEWSKDGFERVEKGRPRPSSRARQAPRFATTVSRNARQRLYGLDAWRESPYYTDRERAALAWTEAVTRVADEHVPDEVFGEAHRHFTDAELVNLTLCVVSING
jgi:hypothetical protein